MTDSGELSLRKSLQRHLSELPVLPTVVGSLMTLDRQAETYFDDVLAVIESDPGFSARILGAANSAAIGAQQPATTLRGAVARLGSVGSSNLILAMSIARVFVPRDDWEKGLWRHGVQVAIAARGLAAKARGVEVSPDEAYLCGLLHDIGRFVLFQEAPDELRAVDEGSWDNAQELLAMELKICGLTHADLGAAACEKWRFPDAVTRVVRDHHTPTSDQPAGAAERLTTLIRIADFAMFPSAMPGKPGLELASDNELRENLLPKLPKWIPLDLPGLRKLLLDTAEEANRVVKTLGLA